MGEEDIDTLAARFLVGLKEFMVFKQTFIQSKSTGQLLAIFIQSGYCPVGGKAGCDCFFNCGGGGKKRLVLDVFIWLG
jgi:hypothetical protein